MAKQRKLPTEPQPAVDEDDSLLLRSAESLGRVIGSLQRELERAAKRVIKVDGTRAKTTARSRKTATPRKPAAARTAAKHTAATRKKTTTKKTTAVKKGARGK
jgi:hypothetical protein